MLRHVVIAVLLVLLGAGDAYAKAKKKGGAKGGKGEGSGDAMPGSVLLFNPAMKNEPPAPLNYKGDPKAIKSPLLFTQIKILKSKDDEEGRLELEEKAATLEIKGAAKKKKKKKSDEKLAH